MEVMTLDSLGLREQREEVRILTSENLETGPHGAGSLLGRGTLPVLVFQEPGGREVGDRLRPAQEVFPGRLEEMC